MDEVAPFKRGKCLDGFSYLLQVDPQGGVARDGARSVQDLRDAIGPYVDLSKLEIEKIFDEDVLSPSRRNSWKLW